MFTSSLRCFVCCFRHCFISWLLFTFTDIHCFCIGICYLFTLITFSLTFCIISCDTFIIKFTNFMLKLLKNFGPLLKTIQLREPDIEKESLAVFGCQKMSNCWNSILQTVKSTRILWPLLHRIMLYTVWCYAWEDGAARSIVSLTDLLYDAVDKARYGIKAYLYR